MIVLGVDPGIDGAVAYFVNGDLNLIEDVPSLQVRLRGNATRRVNGPLLARMLRVRLDMLQAAQGPLGVSAYVELVHALPKQGVSSAFTFGRTTGEILGVLAGLGVPITEVTPQTWKKHIGLRGSDKDASRQAALSRWPQKSGYWTRVKDHNRADAALIGQFGHDTRA